MWQSEVKTFTYDKIWMGTGSCNSEGTINTVAGITLAEGIKIIADADNTDDLLIKWTGLGGGTMNLSANQSVFVPVSDPSSINVDAEANTTNYSFIAW